MTCVNMTDLGRILETALSADVNISKFIVELDDDKIVTVFRDRPDSDRYIVIDDQEE